MASAKSTRGSLWEEEIVDADYSGESEVEELSSDYSDASEEEESLWYECDLAEELDLEPAGPLQPDDPKTDEATRAPPQKKARGHPQRVSSEESHAWKERNEKLRVLLAKQRRSPAEELETMALLKAVEVDRHNHLGGWLWNEIEEVSELINDDIVFQGGEGGVISEAAERAESELDCFRLYFTDAVVDSLVEQTNLHAQQKSAVRHSGPSWFPDWSPVTSKEIWAFTGIAIVMGILQYDDIMEYWSTSGVLEVHWFGEVMTAIRFIYIQSYLHLSDDEQAARTAEGKLCDKLYKVRPLLDSLSVSFPQHYHPRRELNVDEQMIGTKVRRCNFIPKKDKPKKRGVKVWTLCDAKVNYCLGFQVYTGGSGEQSHKMTACRWKDRRDVFCLSTVHGNGMKTTTRRKRGGHGEEERVQKPAMICDFNTFMCGLDVHDQFFTGYQIPQKYKRRWMTIYWRLIDLMILNAFALWKLKHGNEPSVTYKDFRLALSEQLAAPFMEGDAPEPSNQCRPNRLSHSGDPCFFETGKTCAVCQRTDQILFGCVICGEDIRLHMRVKGDDKPSCFALYHSEAVL